MDKFDEATKRKMLEDLRAQHPGKITMDDLPIEELQVGMPDSFKGVLKNMLGGAPIPKMKLKVAYQKWKGKLFDVEKDEFIDPAKELFLPNNVEKTLFKGMNTNNQRLVKNLQGEKFKAPDIFKALKNIAQPNQQDIKNFYGCYR